MFAPHCWICTIQSVSNLECVYLLWIFYILNILIKHIPIFFFFQEFQPFCVSLFFIYMIEQLMYFTCIYYCIVLIIIVDDILNTSLNVDLWIKNKQRIWDIWLMIHAKRRAVYIFLWYNFLTMVNVNLILLKV